MFSSYSKGVLFIILTVVLSGGAIFGQTSGFTYQGRLTDGGTPANGNYDLQIALFDSADGNTQIGQTQSIPNVPVSGGVFTVTLDFGADAFTGASRFLEISVRPSGGAAFTTLTPRQQISSTPYAVRSLNAANAQQLDGVAATQYVKTDDARLSDARDPKASSSNYVQNASSQQAGTNFNISGNGTAGGTLSGNTVNAATQYNLGGQQVMGVVGPNVLKLGNTSNVGIGPTIFTQYKLEVEAFDKNGLRVGTAMPGGVAVSIGENGDFQVDSQNVGGGRFIVKENGNVGIGKNNPTSKLQVAGTVESTSNGFKFPDGTVQSSAANAAIGKVFTTTIQTEIEIGRDTNFNPIITLSLPPGFYLVEATVQFENKANVFLQDNTRHVKCFLNNDLWAYHLGAKDSAMDSMVATMHTVINQIGSQAGLSCQNSEGGQVFAKARRLTAIRVADNPQ